MIFLSALIVVILTPSSKFSVLCTLDNEVCMPGNCFSISVALSAFVSLIGLLFVSVGFTELVVDGKLDRLGGEFLKSILSIDSLVCNDLPPSLGDLYETINKISDKLIQNLISAFDPYVGIGFEPLEL